MPQLPRPLPVTPTACEGVAGRGCCKLSTMVTTHTHFRLAPRPQTARLQREPVVQARSSLTLKCETIHLSKRNECPDFLIYRTISCDQSALPCWSTADPPRSVKNILFKIYLRIRVNCRLCIHSSARHDTGDIHCKPTSPLRGEEAADRVSPQVFCS